MVNVTNLNPVFPDTPSPEGVRKILGLAQQLPVADESKDLAYSSFVFNCLTDPQRMKAIGEVSRILKPGGTAAIFYGSDRYVYKNERGAISSMGLRSNLFYGREVGSVESSEFPILYLFKPYHRT
jgi:SAM-dependent methyltransferase